MYTRSRKFFRHFQLTLCILGCDIQIYFLNDIIKIYWMKVQVILSTVFCEKQWCTIFPCVNVWTILSTLMSVCKIKFYEWTCIMTLSQAMTRYVWIYIFFMKGWLKICDWYLLWNFIDACTNVCRVYIHNLVDINNFVQIMT